MNWAVYADPMDAGANGETLVMVRAVFADRVKLPVTECARESVAVIENVTAAAFGGVPERTPPEEIVSHAGKPVPAHV